MSLNEAWPVEKIDALRVLWPAHSAREIGWKIGKTRDSVIGKANRLGLVEKGPCVAFGPRKNDLGGTDDPALVPDLEAKLVSMWNDMTVMNVTVIANALGRSASNVRKHAKRLGLADRHELRRAAGMSPGNNFPRKSVRGVRLGPAKIVGIPPLVGVAPANLMARTGCCFPVDGGTTEQLFCNAVVPDRRPGGEWEYCPHHRALMTDPAKTRKSRHSPYIWGPKP